MKTRTSPSRTDPSPAEPHGVVQRLRNAAKYWEPRRILYNLVLMAVAVAWLFLTWPHFRPALNFSSLLKMSVLALMANVCYCAAYLVDIPVTYSAVAQQWQRWRPPFGSRELCSRYCWLIIGLSTKFIRLYNNSTSAITL
jgi:hypothetical protein